MESNHCRALIVGGSEPVCVALRASLDERSIAPTTVASADLEGVIRRPLDRYDVIALFADAQDTAGRSRIEALRSATDVPVILILDQSSAMERIEGLEAGADDVIQAPCDPKEIAARLWTVIRRTRPALARDTRKGVVYAFDRWRLDLERRTLRSVDGVSGRLTAGEFELLRVFVERPFRPISRETIMELTRGRLWTPADRSIDVLIGRLRRKIEVSPKRPAVLKTVRGTGYMLACAVRTTSESDERAGGGGVAVETGDLSRLVDAPAL